MPISAIRATTIATVRLLGAWAILLSITALPVAADESEVVVGFAQDNLANDWRLAQVRQIEQALATHPNIRFIYSDARGSTAKQIRDIEDMLIRGVDILVTSPRDSRAMTPVISRAYRNGTPVVLLTRKIDSQHYTTFVAPDDAAIARDAARLMGKELKPGSRVLVLQGLPSTSTAKQRTDVFLDTLHQYPAISVAAIKPANYLRSDAIRAVEELLHQGLPFDAIYAQSDSMASGARIALKKAGIDPDTILIVGIDYINEARQAILAGEQYASFTYPTCAAEAAEVIVKIASGKEVPRKITVPSKMVTKKNADSIAPIF